MKVEIENSPRLLKCRLKEACDIIGVEKNPTQMWEKHLSMPWVFTDSNQVNTYILICLSLCFCDHSIVEMHNSPTFTQSD